MNNRESLSAIEEVAHTHRIWEGTLGPDLRLNEDLDLDSLKALTLAVEVENKFRICLDPESEAEIVTVGDLVAAVRKELER